MHDIAFKSGWDTALYAIPLLATLFLGLFRVDEILSAPRKRASAYQKLIGCDKDGEPLYSDPDGRSWRDRTRHAINR